MLGIGAEFAQLVQEEDRGVEQNVGITNHRQSAKPRTRHLGHEHPCTGFLLPSLIESDGRMGRSLSVGCTPAESLTHTHKTLSPAMPSSIPFGNKVGRAPPSSTSAVTLAWEHPFPVGVVDNMHTKVPQPALHNPYQPDTAMPHNLSFVHSLLAARRDGLHPAQGLKRNGAWSPPRFAQSCKGSAPSQVAFFLSLRPSGTGPAPPNSRGARVSRSVLYVLHLSSGSSGTRRPYLGQTTDLTTYLNLKMTRSFQQRPFALGGHPPAPAESSAAG